MQFISHLFNFQYNEIEQAFNITQLPDELILEVLIRMPLQDLSNVCRTNSRISKLCNDQYFWRLKSEYHFRQCNKPAKIDWNQYYIELVIETFNQLYIIDYINPNCKKEFSFTIFINPLDDSMQYLLDTIENHLFTNAILPREYAIIIYEKAKNNPQLVFSFFSSHKFYDYLPLIYYNSFGLLNEINWLNIDHIVFLSGEQTYTDHLKKNWCFLKMHFASAIFFPIKFNSLMTIEELNQSLLPISVIIEQNKY